MKFTFLNNGYYMENITEKYGVILDLLATIEQEANVMNPSIIQRMLSPREQDILDLFYLGHSCKSVAKILGISHKTVQTHSQKLYVKLNCHSKTEAIYKGLKLNLIRRKQENAAANYDNLLKVTT